MKLTKTFTAFFENEKSGGLLLLFVTLISLYLANSSFQSDYTAFWEKDLGGHSITHWINDGLMTIFFLLIGLELEREIYHGELSNIKNASLPIMAAFGGMLVPAAMFLALNFGTSTQNGAGIPMATDIAFAIGILSLLGNKVPASLKVFLTALAVIDDLGAIIVIAIFYTSTIAFINLAIAIAIWAFLFVLNRMKVHNIFPYLIGGIVMWYFMLNSGIHATITGVILAFVIPFGNGDENSISHKIEHFLHKPVAFVILPLFAMANTCVAIDSDWYVGLNHPNAYGIILGLVIGKPLGIVLFSSIGITAGLCSLPKDLRWAHILGAGMLGGIGFTMSIFITLLAFKDPSTIVYSKIAILVASLLSGIFGFFYLKYTLSQKKKTI
ncbi:Na+/H+ antiporter NhaA [Flavobacterium reichenbachii]|uniref:Na(+)/H(+) antiporter NhaA n=1 Tax=Flavobacterium reichenbachii TaxID=362418 RepID=A0A085ZT01_9FLAO|nr:Na+/H+ antiporter NhaA [Flavobacterium reichenbachii]KFF07565.1 pH-dependent sodium/proton antiporter [Flavobacterium reichenbachii]OXB14208.1 Na+/H+ antiporter NhaA [Flavobacterium reichenbachii]